MSMATELLRLNTFDVSWHLFKSIAELWVDELKRASRDPTGVLFLNGQEADQDLEDEAAILGQVVQDGDLEPAAIAPGTRRRLVAVDGSVVQLGFAGGRPLLSLKAAVVIRSGSSMRVRVVGPLPKLASVVQSSSTDSVALVELRRFESLVQKLVSREAPESVLLLDMPLTRVPELPLSADGTSVIGIAKNSVLAAHLGHLLGHAERVALLARRAQLLPYPGGEVGVTVARLEKGGIAFRADVFPADRWIDALSDVVASDALISGYPETLTVAHAFSRHSWAEIAAIKSVLERRYGLRVHEEVDVRAAVLSPFDGR